MSKHYNLTVTDDNGKSVTTSNTSTEHPEEVLRMMQLAGMHTHDSSCGCGESIEENEYQPTPANDKLDLDDYSKKSGESIPKQKKSLDKAPSRGDNPLEYSLDENEIFESLMNEFEEVEEGKLNPGLQAYIDKKKGKKDDKKDDKEDKVEEKKAKPDFADIDGDGDKKETMKKAAKDKKEKSNESIDEIQDLKKLAGIKQVEAGPSYPGEYDYMDPKYMNQDGSSKADSDAVAEIMAKHPQDVAKMKQTGDLDSGSQLYMDLVDYYSDEMPYGTMKARDGDPVEYILDKLDDMGMLESKVAEEQQVDEAPFPGEYDYSDDKYDADGAVTGVGKQGYDMRFAKWSEDTPSELMMVIKKYNLDPMDAYQMATADVNADIDAIADLHDAYTDRMGIPAGPMDDDMSDLHDIDGGEKWLDSPEYDKVMTMVGDLCSAMGMEGAGREECGQALMKHVDENIPQESVNRLKKLAGI